MPSNWNVDFRHLVLIAGIAVVLATWYFIVMRSLGMPSLGE